MNDISKHLKAKELNNKEFRKLYKVLHTLYNKEPIDVLNIYPAISGRQDDILGASQR